MTNVPQRLASYLWSICLGEKLPVWATLVGIVLGAFVTAASSFWIIPKINQSLERQKIRTEFVIRNLDDFNARTRALVTNIADLHASILRTDTVDSILLQKAALKIPEMQWKAIELAIVFEDVNGGKIVEDYQKSLDDLRVALAGLKSKADLPNSQQAVKLFSSNSLMVVRELAGLGGLRLNDQVRVPRS